LKAVRSIGGKALIDGGVDALNLAPNTDGLSVSSIYSQAILKLDEKGVRVKAVVENGVAAADFSEVRCDRPFLYFIVHKPSGAIVLCGVVNDPTRR
jgi:serine protease inhibitor